MEKRRKSPVATGKIKKKMTKEQMQLAIIRKKETDAKALKIVERLLEPDVDQDWLMESLKDINKCHMEDVIEERAIIKLCGYVLCQKPLTAVYNQRYHISLKDKKVYDITKRKNFCSSACFGASNYLLEQMLTSPLWLRDNEEIPKFRILHGIQQESNISSSVSHGEQVNITNFKNANQENAVQNKESQDFVNSKNDQSEKSPLQTDAEKEMGCIENFVLEAVQNFELKGANSTAEDRPLLSDGQKNINICSTKSEGVGTAEKINQVQTDKGSQALAEIKNNDLALELNQPLGNSRKTDTKKNSKLRSQIKLETRVSDTNFVDDCDDDDDDIIEQSVYPIESEEVNSNTKCFISSNKNHIENDDIIEQFSYPVKNKGNETSTVASSSSDVKEAAQGIESYKVANDLATGPTKYKKQKAQKKPIDINLAAKVEESLREWVTDQTVDYLFGDESTKQKMINAIEMQENYEILCKKLDRLQAEEEREDAEMLKTPALKPAPHFAVLKEEGEKLEIKVRAFYEGKTTFEEPPKSSGDKEGSSDNVETFLPLTDIHAPTTIRRKIFLEKLDQVLPDLLRTLAGNNDVYARASVNYSSVRCSAVKALLYTFSLSAKNIVFKTAEWTLVGLVIIKMLSLSDPYLASLLATKQANLYISMILTAYKLNSDYLNLLVTSFNPNMNPR